MNDQYVLSKIRGALNKIRFGSVEIIVHDGKIIQIEGELQ